MPVIYELYHKGKSIGNIDIGFDVWERIKENPEQYEIVPDLYFKEGKAYVLHFSLVML